MQIKGKDNYKIEILHELTNRQLQSLVCCYQAIIGPTAISLYITLAMEAKNQRSFDSHQRLCALMGVDILAFEEAREKCEEVNLITTYYQSHENKDNYIYCLNLPLPIEQFLSHDVLGRRYLQLVGSKNAEATQSKAYQLPYDKNGFNNISKQFKADVLSSWNRDDEMKFNRVKPMVNVYKAKEDHIDFDYERFIQESNNLTFPIEARTQENLQLIGELATVYGISVDRMRILVGHCVNNSTNVLNVQKLKGLAAFEKPKEKKSKNPYDVSPVQFLMEKQGGIPVTPVDGRLLEYLISELKMNQEVVNVLIEYVLSINNNRLSKNYVERVAGTWIRENINTLQKAKDKIKEENKPKKSNVRQAVLPKTFEENFKQNEKKEELSESEILEIKESLKRLEG